MAASPKTLALRVLEDIWNQKAPALLDALYAARCVIHTPDEHFAGRRRYGGGPVYVCWNPHGPPPRVGGHGQAGYSGGHDDLRFADWKIEQRDVWGSPSLMQQLGAVAA